MTVPRENLPNLTLQQHLESMASRYREPLPPPAPGRYSDMPMEQYLCVDATNAGLVKMMVPPRGDPETAMNARFLMHGKTDATRQGEAIHAALLESDRFDEKYILTPIRGKGLLDYKIELNQEGYVLCSQKMLDIARCARENAHNHPLFAKLLSGIKREHVEQSFFFEWDIRKWMGKMRPDLCRDDIGMWVDIKSTRKIDPFGWCAESAKYSYDVTKAWYQLGIDCCHAAGWIEAIDTYLFAVVENDFPCRVEVYEMGNATTHLGVDRMRAALSRIEQCLTANEWPSERSTDVRPYEHPEYVFEAWGEYLAHAEEES